MFKNVIGVYDDGVVAEIDTLKYNVASIKNNEDFVYVSQVMELANSDLQIPSDKAMVECKKPNTIDEVINRSGLKEYVLFYDALHEYSETYIIQFNAKILDMMEVARLLFETGLCEWAVPNYIWLSWRGPWISSEQKSVVFEVVIYPNPAYDLLQIYVTGDDIPQSALVEIFAVNGTLAGSWTNILPTNFFDISTLPAGMYTVRIMLDKDNVITRKIVKK